MTCLDVHLEGHGLIGKLTADESLALRFAYASGYSGPALSVSLPVREVPYGDTESRAFFGNLLQEGARLDKVAAQYRIDRNDVAGLLSHLGRDCPGALSIVHEGMPSGKMPGHLKRDYTEIPDSQLTQDVADLFMRRPPRQRTEFSLAGVQSKMAVVALPDGRLLEAIDGAPTTHILKVGNTDDEALVENEFVVMKTAVRLGLPVVECEMRQSAGIPFLLVPRFDRTLDGPLVRRLHQEDFCQALSLPASMKYEKNRDPDDRNRAASFANVFALARRTADPVGFIETLVRLTFFNFLVGNVDAHAKNFALLYRGHKPHLALAYDLVCVALYEHVDQGLAMRIGGVKMWDAVERDHWLAFLTDAGIRGKGRDRVIERVFLPMAQAILPTIERVIEEFGLGSSHAAVIMNCVGERVRYLNATMGFTIPVDTPPFGVHGVTWTFS